MNELFLKQLTELQVDPAYLVLYKDLIRYLRKDFAENRSVSIKTITTAIDRQVERVARAKELLLHGDIEDDDYQIIKADCEQRIHDFGTDLQQSDLAEKRKEISLTRSVEKLSHIGTTFQALDVSEQQKIVQAMLCPSSVIPDALSLLPMIKLGLHLLFGINSTIDIASKKKPIYHQQWEEEYARRIIEIERKKNHSISRLQAFEILIFLSIFAKITEKD